MSVQNEKLIEEAAKAIRDVREVVVPRGDGYVSVTDADDATLARAAFAVFEKAHTPTDDEVEALAINYCPEHGDLLNRPVNGADARSYRCRNAHGIDEIHAGFRRSEVPEPSAEVLSDWFTSSHGVAVAAVKPMTDRGPSVMVDGRVISPNDVAALIEFKAQGERFSEILEPSTIWHDVAAFLESKGLADGGIADFIRENAPEPQGEPSDAQVLVEAIEKAISKLHWFPNNGVAEDLRAALRAAGGV